MSPQSQAPYERDDTQAARDRDVARSVEALREHVDDLHLISMQRWTDVQTAVKDLRVDMREVLDVIKERTAMEQGALAILSTSAHALTGSRWVQVAVFIIALRLVFGDASAVLDVLAALRGAGVAP